MRANVSSGNANVYWSDEQSSSLTVNVNGCACYVQDEQAMKDLYNCLHFIFGRDDSRET